MIDKRALLKEMIAYRDEHYIRSRYFLRIIKHLKEHPDSVHVEEIPKGVAWWDKKNDWIVQFLTQKDGRVFLSVKPEYTQAGRNVKVTKL